MPQDTFKACIEACYACAAACDRCSTACLQEDDVKMMARCIALDMDCADICRIAAAFMARNANGDSGSAVAVCRLCAELCTACADECGKHPMDHCQACAAACRHCADECRLVVDAA